MIPRRWCNEIIAWANGADLEWKWEFMDAWLPFNDHSHIHLFADQEKNFEFRIKKDQL
jgi:hypothetical protein